MNNDTNVFNPVDLELSRSTFHYSPTITGTTMAGRLIPAFTWEVLPGDSVKMDLRTLFKMATPLYPTMDVLYADVAFYFVPNRLILSRRYGTPNLNDSNQSWEAFIGAQDNLLNMPIPADGIQLPSVLILDSIEPGCLPDYFCIGGGSLPQGSPHYNAIPFLAYFAIWSENYRDPNMMDPVTWSFTAEGQYVNIDPACNVDLWVNSAEGQLFDRSGSGDYNKTNPFQYFDQEGDEVTTDASHWLPLPTCVFHGYFGSLLPWPQRNLTGVPIFPDGALAPVDAVGNTFHTGGAVIRFGKDNAAGSPTNGSLYVGGGTGTLTVTDAISGSYVDQLNSSNLFANLNQAVNANVNALRAQIQLQRWYEKIARSGNRYDEFEYGLFGVRPHDSGYDRPVYLGGKRIPLNIEMVASTNGGTTSGAAQGAGSLGELGAFSHTNDSDHYFYHSFDDFGTLMCVFTIRHHNTISNGIHKQWMRRTREDFYFPVFAHLGEQETLDLELDFNGNGSVLGYNPAWEEYRTEVDRCCGLLKDGESLDFMTYTGYYGGETLKDFVNASQQIETIDKTLAVKSIASGFQFIYQFNFDFTARRCMPTYSIPGLVDHF